MNNAVPPVSIQPNLPAARRADRQRKLLTEPILFEEESLPRFVRVALVAAATLVIAFVIWASIIHIDEIAGSTGQVVPSGSVKIVQHLEGGTVAEILVTEGQLVQEGQILVRMDPAAAKSELDQMTARQTALLLRAERLRAIVDRRKPDFSALQPQYPDQVADAERTWASQVDAQKTALDIVTTQAAQRRKEVDQVDRALGVAQQQLDLTRQQLTIRKQGAAAGIVSRQIYLETKRAEVTAEGEVLRLQEQLRVARDALAEVETRQHNLALTQQQDALTELGAVTAELEQVKNALAKLQDRVDRLDIRAPVTGLVQDLKVRTPGEVLPAGGIVLRVVPVNDVLEAEVKISPADIGHVEPGQPVKIKISSYDYTRYGALAGTLKSVSPTTFADERGQPYYKGMITFSRSYIGPVKGANPVLPGMSVEADIVTGHRRLIEYLLKPVYVSVTNSFHER